MILSIDLGTTSWKAALITRDGVIVHTAHIPAPLIHRNGFPCYDPDLSGPLRSLTDILPREERARVSLLSLTGMAEAGLLVRRGTLSPLSDIWPWFDRRSIPVFEATRKDPRFQGRPAATGLPDSYKYGLYKLLTLLKEGHDPDRVMWVGLVARAASLMTGETAEDVSIASRTACLDLRALDWDAPFLASLGLDTGILPRLIRQGERAGFMKSNDFGLPSGIPVCIGGHDHFCAAWASGALVRGEAFISTGTAQVVMTPAAAADPSSGLSYGPSPSRMPYTCLGSVQSAGGSVNFWKDRLFPGEDYDALLREAAAAPSPSGLLYFPYLAGSGVPHPDPMACGALLGLRSDTARGTIITGVYEGVALETRYLTDVMGLPENKSVICTGGLTKHPRYMQTLADVLGKEVVISALEEGALYGAARLAAQKQDIAVLPDAPEARRLLPDPRAHRNWSRVYRTRYLPFMNITGSEGFFHGIPSWSEAAD